MVVLSCLRTRQYLYSLSLILSAAGVHFSLGRSNVNTLCASVTQPTFHIDYFIAQVQVSVVSKNFSFNLSPCLINARVKMLGIFLVKVTYLHWRASQEGQSDLTIVFVSAKLLATSPSCATGCAAPQ